MIGFGDRTIFAPDARQWATRSGRGGLTDVAQTIERRLREIEAQLRSYE
jgi:hypothetical protein